MLMKFKGSSMEAKHSGAPFKISGQNAMFAKNLSQEECKFLSWTSSNSDVSLVDKDSFKVKKYSNFWIWSEKFGLTKPEPICTSNANGSNAFVGLAVFKSKYFCVRIQAVKETDGAKGWYLVNDLSSKSKFPKSLLTRKV